MTQKNDQCGFTLIELLVVILIISILAAVAVPQYRLAVDKTRYSSMFAVVTAIKKAEEVFYLETGTYTIDFSKLQITLPDDCKITAARATCKNFGIVLENTRVYSSLSTAPSTTLIYWFSHENTHNDKRQCLSGNSAGERGRRVCKSFNPISASPEGKDCSGNCTSYYF